MINAQAITQWAHDYPWQHDEQVEQDLVIFLRPDVIFDPQSAWTRVSSVFLPLL